MDEKILLDAIRSIVKEETAELKQDMQFVKKRIISIEQEHLKMIKGAIDGGLLAVDLVNELTPRVEQLEEIAVTHRAELMVLESKVENIN